MLGPNTTNRLYCVPIACHRMQCQSITGNFIAARAHMHTFTWIQLGMPIQFGQLVVWQGQSLGHCLFLLSDGSYCCCRWSLRLLYIALIAFGCICSYSMNEVANKTMIAATGPVVRSSVLMAFFWCPPRLERMNERNLHCQSLLFGCVAATIQLISCCPNRNTNSRNTKPNSVYRNRNKKQGEQKKSIPGS